MLYCYSVKGLLWPVTYCSAAARELQLSQEGMNVWQGTGSSIKKSGLK